MKVIGIYHADTLRLDIVLFDYLYKHPALLKQHLFELTTEHNINYKYYKIKAKMRNLSRHIQRYNVQCIIDKVYIDISKRYRATTECCSNCLIYYSHTKFDLITTIKPNCSKLCKISTSKFFVRQSSSNVRIFLLLPRKLVFIVNMKMLFCY